MPLFRSVRSRLTVVTTLIVGASLVAGGVGLLLITRNALISDVRVTLTRSLVDARRELDRGVVTELALLSLGVAVDPFEVTAETLNRTCSPVLAAAYGERPRRFSDFYYRSGVSESVILAYESCTRRTSPLFSATGQCEQTAIAAIGNPVVDYSRFEEIAGSDEFLNAFNECLTGEVLVEESVAAAVSLCDQVISTAFDGVDVLDRRAVEARLQDVLFTYAACMRSNGVPSYPDLTLAGLGEGGGLSVLTGVVGRSVVLPSLETVKADVQRFGRTIAIVVPLLVGVVAVVTWLVVGRALQPVEAIRSRVAEIGAGDLHQRVPDPGTGDEVGRLAATMNRMLDRLQRSSERQRRFVSDASHELRSPLASARTQLEVALAHPGRADWPGVASGVLEEGIRMERLVDDLLALARADEGAVLAHTEELDLAEIAAEEAGRVEGVTVEAEVEEARLRGDPLALRRVVRNLLDNARRHASSRIVLRVALEGEEVVAVVEDDGAGIPEGEREQVFERFARLEEARGRDAGGTGLGLAVVREIVEAHGGTVVAEEGEEGGARLVVRLPTREPE
ncbi:MAG: ATP-binding protein [Acidimicrobiia bacterium]|jgi:signal transduction histidine kinase|nr:ATP-binding protein [Acidimicrobiia bacterium]